MDCYRCLIQWGFTNNTGRPYITFPFKFSNVFTAISCICHNGSPSEANTVYNVSISGMNIGASGGGSGKYWCAFGVAQQQWGNLWAGYTEVLNWYFPLTTSQVYAVCLTKHTKNISSGHNWEPARIEEWNNSYARIHPDGDLGYSVIAICKAQQQWGIISNNKAIFPLVFNVFVSSALLLSRGSGTGTWYGDSSNITLTGISCVTPDYVLSGTYIAIGA